MNSVSAQVESQNEGYTPASWLSARRAFQSGGLSGSHARGADTDAIDMFMSEETPLPHMARPHSSPQFTRGPPGTRLTPVHEPSMEHQGGAGLQYLGGLPPPPAVDGFASSFRIKPAAPAEPAVRVLRSSASTSSLPVRGEWRSGWRPPAARARYSTLPATTGVQTQHRRAPRVECPGTIWHDGTSAQVLSLARLDDSSRHMILGLHT